MRADDLDFSVPPELIAQVPLGNRAGSRLMHYQRATHSMTHRTFSDLPALLQAGDLLVFNDAKVIPARFMLRKSTGGRVEGLFLREIQSHPGRWRVLLRDSGGARHLVFADDPTIVVSIVLPVDQGEFEIQVDADESAQSILSRLGRMPLPPYIKREKDRDPNDDADRESYQTVYARSPGSVAAPTAGLHFTDDVLRDLEQRGIERVSVTLHVGIGTFKPVTTETLEAHRMHSERYEINESAATKLNAAQAQGRRMIAVGTTAARVLESYPEHQPWEPATGETSIFIYPPYRWKRTRALLTNFHLPRSTLIALVAAMVGLEEQRGLYTTAIKNGYRFFSYGDAMFIE